MAILLFISALISFIGSSFAESYRNRHLLPRLAEQPEIEQTFKKKVGSANAFRYAGIAVLGLLVLAPQSLISRSDRAIPAFVMMTAVTLFQMLGVWDGLRFLNNQGVFVSRTQKALYLASESAGSISFLVYGFVVCLQEAGKLG